MSAIPPNLRQGLLEAYLALVRWARPLVLALVAADLLENALTIAVYYTAGPGGWYRWLVFPAFWALSALKWLLALLILVPTIVATLSLPVVNRKAFARVWRALLVARLQLLLLAVFAAAMFVSDQSADAFRRWRDEWWHGVSSAALTVLLAFVLLVTTWRLFHMFCQYRHKAPDNRRIAGAAVVALIAGGVGWFWGLGEGLFVLAGILLVIAALSALTPESVEPPPGGQEIGGAARRLPPLIAGAPLILLGAGALYAAVPEFAYSLQDWEWFAVLGLAGLALQAAGWALAAGGHAFLREHLSPEEKAPAWQNRFLLAALLLVAYVGWRVVWNPWRSTDVLGTHGVFVAAMVAAAFAGFFLSTLAEGFWPPRAFFLVRLTRTPVVVLLLVWAIGAAAVDRTGAYYDARVAKATDDAAELDRSTLTARAAFDEWERGLGQGGEAAPMIFVAAAGGGIRAAYWTAVVLTCVLEGEGDADACDEGRSAPQTAFAMSGISGGSLGLAAYVAHTRADKEADWFDRRLDDDYTAPLVGWALFVDTPLSLIRRDGGGDRAEVLERAWERSWIDDAGDRSVSELLFGRAASTDSSELAKGIFDGWTRGQHFPLLLLNGTEVQDGCRFNASVLSLSVDGKDAGENATTERLVEDCLALRLFELDNEAIYVPPGGRGPGGVTRDDWILASTDDLSDFLCPRDDVRLSTAVLLSARFPWVAPSGRVEKCGRRRSTNIIDGGYFDTSGASPLVELSSELEQLVEEHNAKPRARCIVPLYVQIDTGYADPALSAGTRPWEANVPLQGVRTARNAREANARQAAALAFSGPIPGRLDEASRSLDRFAHIYPRAHPGSRAPLGWTLSKTAREELKRQLERNAREIEKVRGWLSGALKCAPEQAGSS